MENETKIIAGKLKGLRNEKGLSQEEVAKSLGLSRETIRRYENNSEKMSVDILLKMLNIYQVKSDYFFALVYGNLPTKWCKEMK